LVVRPVREPREAVPTIRELWKASGGGREWQRVPTWPVIGWWWAAWIAAGVVERVGARMLSDARTVEPILAANLWLTIAEVVVLAAALLAVTLVRSVIERQETLESVPVPGIGVPPRPDRPELGG
jgi:hypothetical protein